MIRPVPRFEEEKDNRLRASLSAIMFSNSYAICFCWLAWEWVEAILGLRDRLKDGDIEIIKDVP